VSTTHIETFAAPRIASERRPDGSLLLRSRDQLQAHPPTIAHAFRAHAAQHPDRLLATEPGDDARRELTWGEARAQADAAAQAMLDAGLSAERPLMVLSGNSLAHLVLMLGAHTAGVPIVSVSTAYSLASSDHAHIADLAARCEPGLVFADDADAYRPALAAAVSHGAERALAGPVAFGQLLATSPTDAVERAFATLDPDGVAKLLFTSGSTGSPKGVVTTHRMLASNQQALAQIWPFMREEPPVLVDWLPWSHSFGGNHNFNQVIFFGGTLHIDHGKPAPALIERTVQALLEHPPTVYYNVPAGFALLAPRLERDPELARTFFSRLRLIIYAGAALPPALWDQMRALAHAHAPREVPLTASWGATETAPAATSAHFPTAPCGCIGVPIPGTTLKLTPSDDKLEICVQGPNVAPGYHRDPAATAAAFDEEGFYRTGDAVRLVDPDDPSQGLMFDGRIGENFKLVTGTWVTVGSVRTGLVSSLRVIADAVVAGHDRTDVGALAWVDQAAACEACEEPGGQIGLDDPRLRALLATRLAAHNAGAGSTARIERLLLLAEPASIDAGEITDKGYVNQSRVLRRRAALVEQLYAEPRDPAVIVPDRS